MRLSQSLPRRCSALVNGMLLKFISTSAALLCLIPNSHAPYMQPPLCSMCVQHHHCKEQQLLPTCWQ
jgi:hypothetical protein